MGRRYASILNYLGIDWSGIDIGDDPVPKKETSGIIIATPTHSHLLDVKHYSLFWKPILVEKPLGKNQCFLANICNFTTTPLQMINQYAYYPFVEGQEGITEVDYYNTGGDGLIWDCINIIGLARGEVRIRNKSPVWNVTINGTKLDRSLIDQCYVDNISDWIRSPKKDNRDYIIKAHNRIVDYERNQSSDRDPSSQIEFTVAGKDGHEPLREYELNR
jgi:hypothetical protein